MTHGNDTVRHHGRSVRRASSASLETLRGGLEASGAYPHQRVNNHRLTAEQPGGKPEADREI